MSIPAEQRERLIEDLMMVAGFKADEQFGDDYDVVKDAALVAERDRLNEMDDRQLQNAYFDNFM